MTESTYSYEVYDDFLTLEIVRKDKAMLNMIIEFEEVEHVHSYDKYIILLISRQSYIIKKEALPKARNSFLFATK